MKKKILLTLSLAFVVACLLAIYVSAEVFNVSYFDGNNIKETVQTDENGTITLRTERFSASDAPIFNWYTYEGDVYAPGETITVTKDTEIRQFCGYPSTDKEKNLDGGQWTWKYIQLQEDLYFTSSIGLYFGGRIFIDLNGYNIYSSAQHVFSDARSGVFIVGQGSVIHTGTGHVFNSSFHGYNDTSIGMVVGKDVTITTNGTVFHNNNSFNSGWITTDIPLEFHGNITCKKLMHINGEVNEILGLVIAPTKLTVTGDNMITFNSLGGEGQVNLTIDGTFKLTEAANNVEYWTAGFGEGFATTVYSSAFTNGADAVLALAGGTVVKGEITLEDVTYGVLVPSGCSHSYDTGATVSANCKHINETAYTCGKCGDIFVISAGELTDHAYELKEHKPATEILSGSKLFECTVCKKQNLVIYAFNPGELMIDVTVSLADGTEQTLQVKVSDVFVLESEESLGTAIYTLADVKAFGDYQATDIIAVEVPNGISKINFANDNGTLKKISICDYATVSIVSFAKYTALEEIVIGKSNVDFGASCSNKAIRAIRSETEGAKVFFASSVFSGKKTLEVLTMSAYSSYDFGSNSFKETSIKELIFPDYCDPFFRDEAAFYKCAVEYLYVGRGITELMGKPFDYCQYMQKIVLMDVTSFTHEWTFCVQNQGAMPVEVYIHSSEISLPNNTFYQCHGIIIYTNAPITNVNAFAGCTSITKDGFDFPAYTIMYGIPHKYLDGSSEPTCTSDGSYGYSTDCPCGMIAEAEYQVFIGTTTDKEPSEYESINTSVIPALGHLKGEFSDVVFLSGYLQNGTVRYNCDRCGGVGVCAEEIDPLIVSLGYSVSEFEGSHGIVQGYQITTSTLELYASVNESVEYGLIAGANVSGNVQYPLTIENGELVESSGIIKIPIYDKATNYAEIKVVGLTEITVNISFINCFYVFDGIEIKYISNGEELSGIVGASYNSLLG